MDVVSGILKKKLLFVREENVCLVSFFFLESFILVIEVCWKEIMRY